MFRPRSPIGVDDLWADRAAVLDEADRRFGDEFERPARRLERVVPGEFRPNLVPDSLPDQILHWADSGCSRPPERRADSGSHRRNRFRLLGTVQGCAPGASSAAEHMAALERDDGTPAGEADAEFQIRR